MGSHRRGRGGGFLGSSVACALLAACVGQRPPKAPTAEVGEYPTRELTLPNGMHVVMEKSADVGVAGVVLLVGVGSADEPVGKAGLAHLTEHLVLRSRPGDSRSIKERLNDRGVAWNAWTGWDATTYAAYFPAPTLESMLGVMAELIEHPLVGLDDAEIAREIDIVQNERRLRTENGTQSQSLGWLAAEVFPEGFPYAHPVVGTRESLDALGRRDVEDFVRATYSASRATLSVSSPLDFDVQRALIEAAFGELPAAARRARVDSNPGSPPVREVSGAPTVREALVASPTLLVGWSVPSSVTPQASVADVLALMAGDTFADNSDHREIGRAFAGYLAGVQSDLFYLEVTLNSLEAVSPGAVGALLEKLGSRLRRGLYERINSLVLFERYKRAAAVRRTYAFEEINLRAESLAESKHFFSSSGVLSRRDQQLWALDSSLAQAYVESYLGIERARAVVIRPGMGEADAALVRGDVRAGAAPRMPAGESLFSESEVRSWVKPIGTEDVRTGELSNGMAVIVASRPHSVYHSVLVGFAGGESAASVPGVSVAEAWSLIRDEMELSVQGLTVRRYHSADASVELVRSTGSNLELSLNAMRERLGGITIWWPPRRFLDRLDAFARIDSQPPNQMAREFSAALFGDSPYGRLPTSEQVHAVRPNDIYRFRDTVLRPENGVLVIVGNVVPESALGLAEELMGGWSKSLERRPPLAAPTPVAPPAQQWVERDWPGSTRAQLGLSCLLEAPNPQEASVAIMLGELVRGRLFDQLREQLGASYSVTDKSRVLRGGTAVIEHVADVSYDQLVPATKTIEGFVGRRDPTFTAAELERGRRAFAAAFNYDYSTTSALAEALFRTWVLGYGVSGFVEQPQRVFDVTLDRVNGMARLCADHAVRSLLGDMRLVALAQKEAAASVALPPPARREPVSTGSGR